jgi:hypothetical protein
MPVNNISYSNDHRPVVFAGDEEDDPYCDKCGLRLIPWNQGKLLCTDCELLFDAEGILLHKKGFGPVEQKQEVGTDLIPITNHHDKNPAKPSIFDREDKAMMRSGRTLISEETYWPEDH